MKRTTYITHSSHSMTHTNAPQMQNHYVKAHPERALRFLGRKGRNNGNQVYFKMLFIKADTQYFPYSINGCSQHQHHPSPASCPFQAPAEYISWALHTHLDPQLKTAKWQMGVSLIYLKS